MLATLTSAIRHGVTALPVEAEANANQTGEPRLVHGLAIIFFKRIPLV